jgi:hypothetical protein
VTGFVTSAPTKSGPLKAGVTERGTASCPAAGGSGAGWFVTGGGFALGSAVTAYPVDSFAPSDGSWAATAYNNGSGIPGTMSVQADCMQLLRKAGARPITGIRLQTAVSPQVAVRHDQVASVSERCPSGFTVVSGGWWLDDEVIDANSAPHVIASRALNSRTWGVTVLNPPSGASPTAFAVLAVCAKPQR